MSQQDPFYSDMDKTTNAQPKPQASINWPWLPGEYPTSWPVVLSELSLMAIREIVREELQNVLKGDNNNGCTQGKTAQAECDNRS